MNAELGKRIRSTTRNKIHDIKEVLKDDELTDSESDEKVADSDNDNCSEEEIEEYTSHEHVQKCNMTADNTDYCVIYEEIYQRKLFSEEANLHNITKLPDKCAIPELPNVIAYTNYIT